MCEARHPGVGPSSRRAFNGMEIGEGEVRGAHRRATLAGAAARHAADQRDQ
jgi:hypothetical protein